MAKVSKLESEPPSIIANAARLNFALNRKVWGLDLFELDFAFSNIKNTAFLTWNFGFPQVVAQEVGGSRQSATAKVKNYGKFCFF